MKATHERVVVHTESDLLEMVPVLLGFHPSDSIVVLFLDRRGVMLTTRTDLGVCAALDDPTVPLDPALVRLADRSDVRVVVVGYGDDRSSVADVVTRMADGIGHDVLFAAVIVGGRWWFLDDGPFDPGRPYDPASRSAASLGSRPIRSSRQEIEDSIGPVRGRRARAVRRVWARSRRDLAAMRAPDKARRVREALDAACRDVTGGVPLAADRLAFLAAVAADSEARDVYWWMLDPSTAEGFIEVWSAVVRATPRRRSGPALCLLGMAAWLAGEGAMLSICLLRAGAIDPRCPLVGILDAVSRNLLPPSLWSEMRGEPDGAAA
jgi:hypothetical protein